MWTKYYPGIVLASGTISSTVIGYLIWKQWQKCCKQIPKEWKHVGTLDSLRCYPIKSCGVINLIEAECTEVGLKSDWLNDRNMMIVDKEWNFISARKHPKLLLVKPLVKKDILILQAPDVENCELKLSAVYSQPTTDATVWGMEVSVIDCGELAASWLSRFILGCPSGLKLVYYGKSKNRKTVPLEKYLSKSTSIYDTGAFADQCSYLLINDSSVADLNKRIEGAQVAVDVFRPNFLLKGAEPFAEDNWKWIKIGENIFEILLPCGRCVLTTLDPVTAEKNKHNEPLKTLKKYRNIEDPDLNRRVGHAPAMGVLLGLRSKPGIIKLNDQIYVA